MALSWYFVLLLVGRGAIAVHIQPHQPLTFAAACAALFFALAVILSWLWKKRFTHGPMEWLLRKVAG
jgi:uncharacterized membrane protein YeiB